jgi:RNA 3'-terminal phosphate cyclase (ATP)
MAVEIEAADRLEPIHLDERGDIRTSRARAVAAGLPRHIAERELRVIGRELGIPDAACSAEMDTSTQGPGNVLMIEIESEHVTEMSTGFGRRAFRPRPWRKRWRKRRAGTWTPTCRWVSTWPTKSCCPLALAGGGSFRTLPLSSHARTNIDVVRAFLDTDIRVTDRPDSTCRVAVRAA